MKFNFFRKKEKVSSFEEKLTKIHNITKNIHVSQEYIDGLDKKENSLDIEKHTKNPKEHSLRQNALFYAMNYNLQKAIKLCDKAIKINPKGPFNFYLRGRSKADLGFYDDGLDDLNNAIKLDNKYADAYIERARLKSKREGFHLGVLIDYNKKLDKETAEKLKDIMKDYDKGLLLDPNDPQALNQRGLIKLQSGDYKGSIKDFEKALKLIPRVIGLSEVEKEKQAFSIKENIYLAKLYQLKGGICSVCNKKIKNFEPNKNAFTPLLGDGPEIDLDKKPILFCDDCKEDMLLKELKKSPIEKTIREEESNIDTLIDLGIRLKNERRYYESITIYDMILGTNPKGDVKKTTLINKGVALNHLNRFDEAIKIYDEILKEEPNSFGALSNKGVALYHKGEENEALRYYNKALEIEPNNKVILDNKRMLLNFINKSKKNEGNSFMDLIKKGVELENRGKYDEAISLFEKVLRSEGISKLDIEYALDCKSVALINKGGDLLFKKKYKEALKYFEESLKIGVSEVASLTGKGIVYEHLKEYKKAIECYNKALKIEPHDTIVLNNKGYVLFLLGKYKEALKYFNKSLKIQPDNVLALGNKNQILEKLK